MMTKDRKTVFSLIEAWAITGLSGGILLAVTDAPAHMPAIIYLFLILGMTAFWPFACLFELPFLSTILPEGIPPLLKKASFVLFLVILTIFLIRRKIFLRNFETKRGI